MYSIKTQLTVDDKPYLAGIGVGVENNQGIITSQVLIAASRFAIIDPNTTDVFYPFVVQGNAAYIKSAFIENGSITNAKIGDYIQSDDFIEGQRGWRMRKSGTLELNGEGVGYRLQIMGRGVYLTDTETGVQVVELGVLS